MRRKKVKGLEGERERKEREGVREERKGGGKGEEEKEEIGGRIRDRRRVWRPKNVERLTRERANSMPLLEMFKNGEK